MPRPPAFDRSDVVLRATDVFWRRGFQGTSVADLVRATGLNPGSLYAAFGSKKGVFLEVLRGYQEDTASRLARTLDEAPTPLEGIRRFFDGLVGEIREEDGPRGCLMVNTLLEYSRHDADVQRQLSAGLARMEQLFRRAIAEARDRGELDDSIDPAVAAAFLVNNIWGIRVTCRGRPSPEALRGVIETVLAALTAQRGSMRRM